MLVPNPPSTEEVRQKLYRAVGDRLAGYELEQIHGQRKLFNPELKRLFTPAEGSEVFIGRLPRDLFEDELVPPFLEIGPIYEMRVMMNFSGTNRGFAFVMFKNPDTAMRAVKTLNNFEIRRGHQIGVLTSVNNRRIYIGPLQESPNMVSLRNPNVFNISVVVGGDLTGVVSIVSEANSLLLVESADPRCSVCVHLPQQKASSVASVARQVCSHCLPYSQRSSNGQKAAAPH